MSAHSALDLAVDMALELALAGIAAFPAGSGLDRMAAWEAAGLCDQLKGSGRRCDYTDGSLECEVAQARNWPCDNKTI